MAPLILPYKTVHGPVSAWSKILHVIPINFDLVNYLKALSKRVRNAGSKNWQRSQPFSKGYGTLPVFTGSVPYPFEKGSER